MRAWPSNHSQGFETAPLRFGIPILRTFLLLILLISTAACGPAPEPPNLVLISLDTLRADRLGCYGYRRETSPNLDRLAGEAVLFEHAVSQANETVRSHRSLLTSAWPVESMVRRDLEMLSDRLREAGFATGAFTDGGPMSKDFGFDQGFDEFVEWGNGLQLKRQQALKWLDGLPEGQRFFLFVHCFDIHAPYAPPADYREIFGKGNPSTIKPEETAEIGRRIRNIPSGREGGDAGKPVMLSSDDRRRMSDLYDCGIRYTDEILDQFFSDLETRGMLENSIVVVFSDHGEEFWDHGSVLHGHTLYQELTHVPLIVRVPGLPAARVSERVGLIDLLPTLLDILELDPLEGAAGVSLAPLLHGAAVSRGGGALISEGIEVGHYSVIEEGYKLIHRPDRRRYELYDLEKDPLEKVDIAGREKERVARMKKVMRRHHEALAALPRIGPPKAPPAGKPLEQRTVDRLRQLGYLEPDPKKPGS
jgi:arylsulfatase A-like enzyme